MNNAELIEKIKKIRCAIRYHRDQVEDDRCWLDDYLVWAELPDSPPPRNLTLQQKLLKCEIFYANRRADEPDPRSEQAILDPALWDRDLEKMSLIELAQTKATLLFVVGYHRDLEEVERRARTIKDDRDLYSIALPEKIPADFRLPPRDEFLGRAKSGAGCPNFWDSHEHCGRECNLYEWGPCK
ncbi:MAG: hypothetical protein A2928_01975 [Candidatus Taylorbacteria bacterium RIFCSPLOWO2_01_FULL_45_15b]|uniref:Uncharacterized protein n=1 Tax=Candidatus Taylorbacteria bacterium RIFCSPLOWO2_01_FULL_45_15b TaxID=1802319 RepID=A0A1G2NEF3_9BACT|nr:MAG: hypothetical protein A2928_01975 [Candidatus Taylorbacteria bacterium RIFCSPLOWO2_01_FULL_45_15b]